MALEFLTSLAPMMQTAGQIAGPVQSILGAIRGDFSPTQRFAREYGMDPFNRPMTPSEREAISLYKALSDPDNTYVQSLADEEKQAIAEDFLSAIRSQQLADRRAQAMGRPATFFDPERADEAKAFMISRALPGMQAQAREAARERIRQTAAGLSGFVPTQSARQQQEFESIGQDIAARQKAAGGMDVLTGGMGRIGKGVEAVQDILKVLGRTPPIMPIPTRKPPVPISYIQRY